MVELSKTDLQLLTELQKPFPLTERPFADLGRTTGLTESETLAQTRHFQDSGILRHIRGVFEARALGYHSVLVAAHTEPSELKQTAAIVSEHPGVSHNYGRTHWYNLWFTIAVGPGIEVADEINALTERAGILSYRVLPVIRQFKVGVRFDLEKGVQASSLTDGSAVEAMRSPEPLTDRDIALIRALQEPLPLVENPFAAIAEEISIDPSELIDALSDFLKRGILRRYAGMLAHRMAGFNANAMACWNVPEDFVEVVGRRLAEFPEVSHCYQRPVFPNWPYNIFTMLHARKLTECDATARQMSAAVDVPHYALLLSTREFKKAPVRYFEEKQAPMAIIGGKTWPITPFT